MGVGHLRRVSRFSGAGAPQPAERGQRRPHRRGGYGVVRGQLLKKEEREEEFFQNLAMCLDMNLAERVTCSSNHNYVSFVV